MNDGDDSNFETKEKLFFFFSKIIYNKGLIKKFLLYC